MSYEIFVSHASEDKDAFVRPLAEWLSTHAFKVWYDEYVLKAGDSIRDKINDGLRTCRYGVVVLSPRFFAKPWPTRELNALYNLVIKDPERRLIPIILDMTFKEVEEKDPLLADVKAVSAGHGVESVGRHLVQAMIGDEERRRHQGKTTYKHARYSHNYYRPPEDVPRFGYRFDPPYEFDRLEAELRPREILMCFLANPTGWNFNSACHLTSLERLREFQQDYGPELSVYAVEIDKLRGEFDSPFSCDELDAIHNKGRG